MTKANGFGFRKSDPELVAMFNKALTAAKAEDGTVKKLAIKWFKLDVGPRRKC